MKIKEILSKLQAGLDRNRRSALKGMLWLFGLSVLMIVINRIVDFVFPKEIAGNINTGIGLLFVSCLLYILSKEWNRYWYGMLFCSALNSLWGVGVESWILSKFFDMKHMGITLSVFLFTIGALVPVAVPLIINRNDGVYVARVKLVNSIIGALFIVPTVFANIYVANIIDPGTMPGPWKVTQEELNLFNVSTKDYWRLALNSVSMPFLISLALIRSILEGIAYSDKLKTEKAKNDASIASEEKVSDNGDSAALNGTN